MQFINGQHAKILSLLLILLACETKTGSNGTRSPYAGLESRDIKALSETEVSDYMAGAGMGLAKAAELNGYPGPKHVLDLRSELGLTTEQIEGVNLVFKEMQDGARALGARIIEAEQQLNMIFAHAHANPESLERFVNEAGELKTKLRFVHLNAHLQMMDLLSSLQVEQYIQRRGYNMPGGMDHDLMEH